MCDYVNIFCFFFSFDAFWRKNEDLKFKENYEERNQLYFF